VVEDPTLVGREAVTRTDLVPELSAEDAVWAALVEAVPPSGGEVENRRRQRDAVEPQPVGEQARHCRRLFSHIQARPLGPYIPEPPSRPRPHPQRYQPDKGGESGAVPKKRCSHDQFLLDWSGEDLTFLAISCTSAQ
jgi:hypothetical protein